MSETKHTPGEWKHRNGRIFHADREELTIANVARGFDGDHLPANGDLLATAPDLLAALEMVRDADDDCKRDGLPPLPAAARARIDTAIKKARGGTT